MTQTLYVRILSAIDALQSRALAVTLWEVAAEMGEEWTPVRFARVSRELRAMSKAGIVVYDRKASGWRRA